MPTLNAITPPASVTPPGWRQPADPAQTHGSPRIIVDRAKLTYAMKRRGMTNISLANVLGKHTNSISRLKREQSCTLADLARLCEALSAHPLDLLSFEGFE